MYVCMNERTYVCIYERTCIYINIKGKGHSRTWHEDPRERGAQRDSSTISLTSALGWWVLKTMTWPFHPQERPVTHCTGGCVDPKDQSWRVRKISLAPVFDARTVKPVASRYTDWAIPGHLHIYIYIYKYLGRILPNSSLSPHRDHHLILFTDYT